MRTLICLALCLIGMPSAYANEEARQCAKIDSLIERLKCYDSLFKDGTPTFKIDVAQHWTVSEDISAFDDSKSVYIRTVNTNKAFNEYGKRENTSLHLRCNEGEIDAYIVYPRHLDLTADQSVLEYRLDKTDTAMLVLDKSTDGKALGFWKSKNAKSRINELLTSKTLATRTSDYNGATMEAIFNLTGLSEIISPLKEACNWKP